MSGKHRSVFVEIWPRGFLIFMGLIEILATVLLILTELANVAASFWLTNVFAGFWCALVMIVHFIALFVTGKSCIDLMTSNVLFSLPSACCSPGPTSALVTLVITFVALVASATLIVFDAIFLALPSTCLLTPSCSTEAASPSSFAYPFQQSFFTSLNSISTFQNYGQYQAKVLFQSIQLGVGCLCLLVCLLYVIIYFVTASKTSKQVSPHWHSSNDIALEPAQRRLPAARDYDRSSASRVPQSTEGEDSWNTNGNRRY